jgi:hypothetical protein
MRTRLARSGGNLWSLTTSAAAGTTAASRPDAVCGVLRASTTQRRSNGDRALIRCRPTQQHVSGGDGGRPAVAALFDFGTTPVRKVPGDPYDRVNRELCDGQAPTTAAELRVARWPFRFRKARPGTKAVAQVNDPERFRELLGELGQDAEFALEATYGWEWLAELLESEGREVHLARSTRSPPRSTSAADDGTHVRGSSDAASPRGACPATRIRRESGRGVP